MMGKGYYDGEKDWEIEFKSEDNEFEDFIEWFEDEEEINAKDFISRIFFDLNTDIPDPFIKESAYDLFARIKKENKYKITGHERDELIEKKELLEITNKKYEEFSKMAHSPSDISLFYSIINRNKAEIEIINALLNETMD